MVQIINGWFWTDRLLWLPNNVFIIQFLFRANHLKYYLLEFTALVWIVFVVAVNINFTLDISLEYYRYNFQNSC